VKGSHASRSLRTQDHGSDNRAASAFARPTGIDFAFFAPFVFLWSEVPPEAKAHQVKQGREQLPNHGALLLERRDGRGPSVIPGVGPPLLLPQIDSARQPSIGRRKPLVTDFKPGCMRSLAYFRSHAGTMCWKKPNARAVDSPPDRAGGTVRKRLSDGGSTLARIERRNTAPPHEPACRAAEMSRTSAVPLIAPVIALRPSGENANELAQGLGGLEQLAAWRHAPDAEHPVGGGG
jgi:hypothetical protein